MNGETHTAEEARFWQAVLSKPGRILHTHPDEHERITGWVEASCLKGHLEVRTTLLTNPGRVYVDDGHGLVEEVDITLPVRHCAFVAR